MDVDLLIIALNYLQAKLSHYETYAMEEKPHFSLESTLTFIEMKSFLIILFKQA